jgi:ribonuclease BN (tRNA processing enzyme)
MSLDDIATMATRAKVKTVVLSHLTQRFVADDYMPWAEEVKKPFFRPSASCGGLDGF